MSRDRTGWTMTNGVLALSAYTLLACMPLTGCGGGADVISSPDQTNPVSGNSSPPPTPAPAPAPTPPVTGAAAGTDVLT